MNGASEFYGPRSAIALAPILPLALHANVPNPFNPSTTIAFDLPGSMSAELNLYDSTGRKVRRLVGGLQEAGSHHAVWDGRDDSGREVRSGVYFAQLKAGGETKTRKLVLMR